MGKKAALTAEQKEDYQNVLKQLQANGALKPGKKEKKDEAPPEVEAPAKRARTKTPDPAKVSKASTKSEADPKPDAAPKKAKRAAAEPSDPPAKASKKTSSAPKPDSTQAPEKSTEPPASPVGEFFDPELGLTVSWKNYAKMVVRCKELYGEDEEFVRDACVRALGPCPAEHLAAVEAASPKAASEEHPGPILEDRTLDNPKAAAKKIPKGDISYREDLADEELDGEAWDESSNEEEDDAPTHKEPKGKPETDQAEKKTTVPAKKVTFKPNDKVIMPSPSPPTDDDEDEEPQDDEDTLVLGEAC